MHQINHLPPERMTPEQRRCEIASLLANGLARLRIGGAEQSAHMAEASEFELGFSGNQRNGMDSSAPHPGYVMAFNLTRKPK